MSTCLQYTRVITIWQATAQQMLDHQCYTYQCNTGKAADVLHYALNAAKQPSRFAGGQQDQEADRPSRRWAKD